MDLSKQLRKLRTLNDALKDTDAYITRVVPTLDNTPFLSVGDLVAFESVPTDENHLSENDIYLFIYSDLEVIGFVKKMKTCTLTKEVPYTSNEKLSSHKLLFISK
ncbi:hypothetical protein [Vibrio mediterranei]|uniref:hypothetical protein n=1 Tax=Vibrio mediterranei TaxID=689 RepID=UPI00148C717B|nr:hypothetical protein [Vibrio mediterranei]NOI26695.1 hypothetical protein [Vibrio mediterranei]